MNGLFVRQDEPGVNDDYRIVFRADGFAVIDKPGNLPCHPSGRYSLNTLASLLRERDGFASPQMVNRLDRETSGLVVVAETREAASALGKLMMAHEFAKHYVAIVEGDFPDGEVRARGWIVLASSVDVSKLRVFVPDEHGDPARPRKYENGEPLGDGRHFAKVSKGNPVSWCETVFSVMRRADGMSMLSVQPLTGRPHQIRATLKRLGYPVAGDKLYGPDETIYARMCREAVTPEDRAALRLPRQALHSDEISFPHPFTREMLAFRAPLPADMLSPSTPFPAP